MWEIVDKWVGIREEMKKERLIKRERRVYTEECKREKKKKESG